MNKLKEEKTIQELFDDTSIDFNKEKWILCICSNEAIIKKIVKLSNDSFEVSIDNWVLYKRLCSGTTTAYIIREN